MWMILKKEGLKLKFLSTSRRKSFLLVVRVQYKGWRRITIPVSFWALETGWLALGMGVSPMGQSDREKIRQPLESLCGAASDPYSTQPAWGNNSGSA